VKVCWSRCMHASSPSRWIDSSRFSVQNASSNLLISNVSIIDAGLYLCAEDGGLAKKHLIILSVIDDRKPLKFLCFTL